MKSIYLETTVVGHIAGRLHPVATVLARQQVTRQWWESASDRYLLFVSDLVLAECGDGDEDAASERLNILEGIDVLQTTAAANELAASLIEAHAVPKSEPRDALHIALAAINGIDYLATWNFKHIMNPSTQHLIDAVCRNAGIESAVICTPEQLLVTYDDP
ncbi:MAG: PIN domain-containing protein [Planctomycetota bacterium]|nr:MAG: PIN domain-containing protein [Planctomycetota bacterium]